VKTTFALLSEAMDDPALAGGAQLTADEQRVVADHVPWTRLLQPGRGRDPDGVWVADLVERVASEPDRFVLKRAWDYGGRAVFIGSARNEPAFRERTVAAFGEPLDWRKLCQRAAQDRVGGGFVAQARVHTDVQHHLVCSAEGPLEAALYVDYSAYASVGLDEQPAWGGVCRGSSSQVVNIVGGGGVLPLLTEEVAQRLQAALATH
jgi:hypothetical protein